MATPDVPGANPAHKDFLSANNWAEHDDGSLILVNQIEEGIVIFSLFDLLKGTEYRTAMEVPDFQRKFSTCFDKKEDDPIEQWTWHDKTKFPWDRLFDTDSVDYEGDMSLVTTYERAKKTLDSAAERVGKKINAKIKKIEPEKVKSNSSGIFGKLKKWFSDD